MQLFFFIHTQCHDIDCNWFFSRQLQDSSPLQNGLRRTPPKENGDLNNSHAKKEPVSPRSGRSSASSTPAPTANGSKKSISSSDEGAANKPATPNPGSGQQNGKPGLPVPPFGIPGFPGGPPLPPGAPFPGAENGYRPPFDPHPALRPPLGIPPGGKP